MRKRKKKQIPSEVYIGPKMGQPCLELVLLPAAKTKAGKLRRGMKGLLK
jgi:hypothetical protein